MNYDNKALWIFPNIRESVNCLPEELKGEAYKAMIEYGFGEEVDTGTMNPIVKMAFELAKPFLRLRGVAGAPTGNQNAKKDGKNNIENNIEKQSKTILIDTKNNSFNNHNNNKNDNINGNNKPPISPFDEFWSNYPKTRAGSKEKAYHSFCKAVRDGRATEEQIISACKKYAQSDEVKRGYAKGAAAWLNDDRFNCDYAPPKTKTDDAFETAYNNLKELYDDGEIFENVG